MIIATTCESAKSASYYDIAFCYFQVYQSIDRFIYKTFTYIHVSSFPHEISWKTVRIFITDMSIHFPYLSSSRSSIIKFRLHIFHVIAEMYKYKGFFLLSWRIYKSTLMESKIRGISRSYGKSPFFCRNYGEATKQWKWPDQCEWFTNTLICRNSPRNSTTRQRASSRR